ncbi:MAG: CoA transferase [Burkholderiaceae bacterium]|nr:CoA transferase [Burkholderiaceae bacterium]
MTGSIYAEDYAALGLINPGWLSPGSAAPPLRRLPKHRTPGPWAVSRTKQLLRAVEHTGIDESLDAGDALSQLLRAGLPARAGLRPRSDDKASSLQRRWLGGRPHPDASPTRAPPRDTSCHPSRLLRPPPSSTRDHASGSRSRHAPAIRVLRVTALIAGPSAARYLSDHGAEVIKIERFPNGDVGRVTNQPRRRAQRDIRAAQRGQARPVRGPLSRPEGPWRSRATFARIISSSSAFTPVMAKLGLGYDRIGG